MIKKTQEEEIEEALEEASVNAHTQHNTNTDNLPESPSSVNVKVWIDGYGCIFTLRDKEMFNCVKKLTTLIGLFKEKGWKPTWDKVIPAAANNPAFKDFTNPTPENGTTPVCGVHGTNMEWKEGVYKDGVFKFGPEKGQPRAGKPYGFWSCGQTNADGSWCTFKPKKK